MTGPYLPSDWDLVGGNPAPGDPWAFDELSQFFAETATIAGDSQSRLRRLADGADESIWRGDAADAFREDLMELPEKLLRLHDSYQKAGDALSGYGRLLRQFQLDAGPILDRAITADQAERDALALASGSDAPVIGRAGYECATIGPAGPVIRPAFPRVAPSGPDPTEDPRAALAAARSDIETIRQQRENAEGRTIHALQEAGDAGIQNKSRWQKLTGAVGNAVDNLDEGFHSALRVIGELADNLSTIITVVGIALVLAAAVCATGGLALGPLAALGGSLWAASGTAFTAAAVAGAVSVTAKGVSKGVYNDADLSWGGLAVGAGMSALAFAGGPIKVLKGGSGFLKGTKVFQAGSRAFSTLDASTRVGYMALRAQQLGTTATALATGASSIWSAVSGTAKNPTVAGMLFKAGDEVRGVWANLADHPIKYIPVVSLSGGLTATHTPVAAH